MTNKEFFIQCWQAELPRTIGALVALPSAEKLGYRPAPKNRSAKQLVDHIVCHVEDLVEAVQDKVLNHRIHANYPDVKSAIEVYESESAKLISLLQNLDDKSWNEEKIEMRINGNKIAENTIGGFCWMLLNDVIHHRGQLSTYYRPMGAVQPSIYGPTAEMTEAMMAKAN